MVKSDEGTEMHRLRQVTSSLSIFNGYLIHGSRMLIPVSMRRKVLELLHLGHFGMQRMKQLARTASTCQTLMMISKQHADTAYFVLSIRIDHPNVQSTHGCFQRNPGADSTSTMQSTSWAQTGCWPLTHFLNIHASIPHSLFQPRQQLIYWNRTSHILVTPIPW